MKPRLFLTWILAAVCMLVSCRQAEDPSQATAPAATTAATLSDAAATPLPPTALPPTALPPTAAPPTAVPPTAVPTPAVVTEWAFPMKGEILSSAALAGGTLYFGSYDHHIYAVDAETGQQKWAFETGNQVGASPAVADGVVYIGSADGNFYALDAATGEQRWVAVGPSISSPAVAGGLVIFGTVAGEQGDDGEVLALQAADGSVAWRVTADAETISSPRVVDGVVYTGAGTDVVALKLDEGAEIWRFDAGALVQGSPAVGADAVFIGSNDGNFYALDRTTGEPRWTFPAGAPTLATPWIEDGIVIAAPTSGSVTALDEATGDVLWQFQTGGMVGSPRVANGTVYVPSLDGTLYALNTLTGAEQWRWSSAGPFWASPLIDGDHVYIGSHDRHFYALDATGPRIEAIAYQPPLAPQPTAVPEPVIEPQTAADGQLPWWNDRVFYEVFVRSFKDSNGDGIGDLQGLISRLDYLNDGDPATTDDLGVTGIWLMPVAQSPSYHGYDATDYYTIEDDYGTNEDFKQLMDEAHKRGIAVIVDLVMNHTSSDHPWFLESKEPGSPQESWYIWETMPEQFLSPWGSQVWHQDVLRYFYGIFWAGMPDLNYNNGDVTAAMYDIIRFWLNDMDADGFRLDAVRHLIEDGAIQENTAATHEWLGRFDDYVHTIEPDALTVGEVWDETAEVLRYIPDELDTAFEFDLAGSILGSVKIKNNASVYKAWQKILDNYPEGQYATFLTNHDQDRVFTQLRRDSAAAKVAASLYLTGPGIPFIYYGEEIGMVGAKPDEDIRRPMAWDGSEFGSFSAVEPWEALPRWTETANIESQMADPDSLLNHYRTLVRLRNEHPALRTGSMALVRPSVPQIAAYLRQEGDEIILVVVNLSDEPVGSYALSLVEGPLSGETPAAVMLMGEGVAAAPQPNAAGGFDAYTPLESLPPRSTTVISLQ